MRKLLLLIVVVVALSCLALFVFKDGKRRAGEGPPREETVEPPKRVEEKQLAEGPPPEATPAPPSLPLNVREVVGRLKDDDLRISAAGQLVDEWAGTGDDGLYSLIEGEAIPLLLEQYRASDDAEERGEIIDLLGRFGSDSAVAFLSEVTESGDRASSLRAVAVLARSSKEQAGAAVADFIGSTRPESVRWKAAHNAGSSGAPSLAQPLVALFQDGEPRAKIMAAHAMKGIYDRTHEERLGRVLTDEVLPSLSDMAARYLDPQIRRDSWQVLGYVDPAGALGLYRRQGEMPYAIEERVVLSIGGNGDERVAADAVALFEGAESDKKKISACRIAGLIGGRHPGGPAEEFTKERAIPFLEEAVTDKGRDQRSRRQAVIALGEVGGSECLPLLRKLTGEFPREAGRAITQIQSRSAARKK